MPDSSEGNPNIQVEITDATELHCFRLVLNPQAQPGNVPPRLEVMLHARSLVDLIHKCSLALCDWQKATTDYLLDLPGTGPHTKAEAIAVIRAAKGALGVASSSTGRRRSLNEVANALDKLLDEIEPGDAA